MFLRPTPAEERWLELAHRYPALRTAAEARAGGWKTPSLLSRALLFVLGLIAASMIAGSFVLLPGRFLVAGIAMIAAAEWLVRNRRLVSGGIEEALLACGCVAVVAQGLAWTETGNDAVLAFALSAAILAAGLRLGNPLFTTLAAIGVSLAIALAGKGSLFDTRPQSTLALTWCATLGIAALLLGARPLRRPSHDRMLDGLVIAMPLAAFGWALAVTPSPLTLARLAEAGLPAALPAALAAAFAIAWTIAGLRRRSHAALIGALLSCACFAWAVRELTGMPLYARLMLWGSLAFVVGLGVERWLRTPRDGITSAPFGASSTTEDLLQTAGAAHLTPAAPASQGPFEGGGGSFGGGGASGRF